MEKLHLLYQVNLKINGVLLGDKVLIHKAIKHKLSYQLMV